MDSGAIELRSGGGGDIALCNEEINRKRLERANYGGPVRVTDPAAFARMMAEMRKKAEEQKAAEAQREAERAKREGANYKTKEEREREAKEAKAQQQQQQQGEDEARQLERRFDPEKNYYVLLGLDRAASTAEIKRAYKKLALAYHPDKHKAEDAEQQAAIADKFKEIVEAFDVLSDEAQRAVYDKIRDYKEANPGRGLPPLSPEELAMMRSGAAELRRLRRMGNKLTKHKPMEHEVWASLEKLNGGGMKRVTVERQRVDADGSLIQHSRTYHLVIRKGMQEGDRLTFEGEGEETVDTQPGDLFFVLRQKPHSHFKRSGRANLEHFARALSPGEVLFAVDLTTLQRRRLLLRGSAFALAAGAGGGGGLWRSVVAGQGLWDPQDPWDNPPGDLIVQVRYPGLQLGLGNVASCLRPRPLYLLGSAADPLPAAAVGGWLAAALCHQLEAEEMLAEERVSASSGSSSSPVQGEAAASTGSSSGGSSGAQGSPRAGSPPSRWAPLAVCLSLTCAAGAAAEGAAGAACQASPAAQALLAVLRRRVPGLRAVVATVPISSAAPAAGAVAGAMHAEHVEPLGLLDDEYCALLEADIVVLDQAPLAHSQQQLGQQGQRSASGAVPGGEPSAGAEVMEGALRWLAAGSGEGAAVAAALVAAFWRGARLVGIGGACALLGRSGHSAASGGLASPPTIVPWYTLRAGGGTHGWSELHAALGALGRAAGGAAARAAFTGVGVGIMAGSACSVDPNTGAAELLVAPTREALVATARWAAAQEGGAEMEEAEEDFGFFYAARCAR